MPGVGEGGYFFCVSSSSASRSDVSSTNPPLLSRIKSPRCCMYPPLVFQPDNIFAAESASFARQPFLRSVKYSWRVCVVMVGCLSS